MYVLITILLIILGLLQQFLYTHIYMMGFPGGSDGKESAYNAGDLGSIPGSGRSSLFMTITLNSLLVRLPISSSLVGFLVAQMVKNPPAMWEAWV